MFECDITEVFIAFLLFYTTYVNFVEAERSFCKMKIIKKIIPNKIKKTQIFTIDCNRSHGCFEIGLS